MAKGNPKNTTVKDDSGKFHSRNLPSVLNISYNRIATVLAYARKDGTLYAAHINKKNQVSRHLPSVADAHKDKLIEDMSFLPTSESTLCTVGNDNIVAIRDLNTGGVLKSIKQGSRNFLCQYSYYGKWLAVVDRDNWLFVYDVAHGYSTHYTARLPYDVTCLTWANTDEQLVIGDRQGKIHFCQFAETLKELTTVEAHVNAVTALHWDPLGASFYSGGSDGNVFVWDIDTLLTTKIVPYGSPVQKIAVSGLLMAVCYEKSTLVYNLHNDSVEEAIDDAGKGPCFAFFPGTGAHAASTRDQLVLSAHVV